MEKWKVETLINNFTDACNHDDSGAMIKATKRLRRAYYSDKDVFGSKKEKTREKIATALVPLLDDQRSYVQQLVACVLVNLPIAKKARMPEKLIAMTEDDCVLYSFQKNPDAEKEWQRFVERHDARLKGR